MTKRASRTALFKIATQNSPVSACATKGDARAVAECIAQAAGVNTAQFDCLSNTHRSDPTTCLNIPNSQNWLDTKKCVDKYTRPLEALTACLTHNIDPEAEKLAACLIANAKDGTKCADQMPGLASATNLVQCLRKNETGASALLTCAGAANIPLNPTIIQCLQTVKTDTANWITTCIPGANAGPLSCFAKFAGHNDDVLTCLANSDSKLQTAVAVIRCVSSANQPSDLIATCTQGFIKDQKTRQLLACAAQDTSDMGSFAGCVAGPFVGGETGRLLACAAQSQSYAGLALCAAGPKMNQEWMIAAQCAASSGGVPVTVAACTAGWLTLNELSKCFSKGIGGSGCFGKNNTIVKAFQNAANDITKGPGPNNEIVKALDHAGLEVKDVSFATPLGGHDAFLPKAGRDFDEAKNKAGKWIAKRFGW